MFQAECGRGVPFLLYGGVSILGLFFVYTFVPETRGKTAAEIAHKFHTYRFR